MFRIEEDHGQLLEPVWSLYGHYEKHKSWFTIFLNVLSFDNRFDFRYGTKAWEVYSTEGFELTFVWGIYRSLCDHFNFLTQLSAHILNILHCFFNAFGHS